jgi:cbb3-type cytochrome oxidase subunit 3
MNLLSTVFAQLEVNLQAEGTGNFGGATIPDLITFAITTIIVVAGLIFFFMLVIGGLKWILSGGDKGQTEAARSQITAALVGLVILFSAWAITNLVQTVFGIDILNFTIPALVTAG